MKDIKEAIKTKKKILSIKPVTLGEVAEALIDKTISEADALKFLIELLYKNQRCIEGAVALFSVLNKERAPDDMLESSRLDFTVLSRLHYKFEGAKPEARTYFTPEEINNPALIKHGKGVTIEENIALARSFKVYPEILAYVLEKEGCRVPDILKVPHRLFDWPSGDKKQFTDYKSWVQRDSWDDEEAACLLKQLDPAIHIIKDELSYRDTRIKGEGAQKLLTIIKSWPRFNGGVASPFWYIDKALLNGIDDMPRELLAKIREKFIKKAEHDKNLAKSYPMLADLFLDKSQLPEPEQASPLENKQKRTGSQKQREDNNLIKIIAALVAELERVDPEILKTPAKYAVTLSSKIKEMGHSVSKDTILKALKL